MCVCVFIQDAVETTSSTRKMSVPKKKIEKKKQKGDRQRVGGRWSGKLVEPEKEEEEVKVVPSKSSLQGKVISNLSLFL